MTELGKSLDSSNALPHSMIEWLDRAAITRVVSDWGLCRDAERWDRLRTLYTPDAIMLTTWFAGPAGEFVDRSILAAKRGSKVQHFIGAASIEINGGRAIAETRMILMVRSNVRDVEVDVTCFGRFYDRFVRHENEWRISKRVPIYERDRLNPGAAVPLDHASLAGFAEGYRHLAYVQMLGGATLTPGLPTAGSEEEARLCAEGAAWLHDT